MRGDHPHPGGNLMDTLPSFPLILTFLVAVGLIAMGLLHRPRVRCSSCHKRWPHRFAFCPQCGAMLPHAHHEQTVRLPGNLYGTDRRARRKTMLFSEERSEQCSGNSLLADPQQRHVSPLVRPLCHVCWEPLQPGDRFCGHCGSKVPVRKKRHH